MSECLYQRDAYQATVTLLDVHRLVSEIMARTSLTCPLTLVLSPHDDANLRLQLMYFTPDQLAAKSGTVVNPFDRVGKICVSTDLPKGELRVESPEGYVCITNLAVYG